MLPNSLTQNCSQIRHMVMTLLTFLCNPNPNPSANPWHKPITLSSIFYNKNIGQMPFTFGDLMY